MWYYRNELIEEIPDGYYGFVYCIHNLSKNKRYIGKKQFYSAKSKMVKGKKKRIMVPSDWLVYTGSNADLNRDILEGDEIRKEILHLCKMKSEMSYLETYLIFMNHALISDVYYNHWVTCKITEYHLNKTRDGIVESLSESG